jgi:hypothetical protein
MIYDKLIKKVHGPYSRKDNRKHVVIVFEDDSKKTVSYPKYLMEQQLGRELDPDLETIDHINRDFTNNDISNLQIIERSEHAKLDAERTKEQQFVCEVCNKEFTLTSWQLHDAVQNRKKGKTGPYCSRSCAGKATHLKNKAIKQIVIEKYKINK